MRRPLLLVLLLISVAVLSYHLGKPAKAPADSRQPVFVAGNVKPARIQGHINSVAADGNETASSALPITQVVLYSNGVGYFQRDGYVEDNARVDLTFPVQDVNDLLKSMVLQDLGGGHVSAVGYDSHDPLDKTLNSFAIQLTNNPTRAEIVNQARGEKVEITLSEKRSGDVNSLYGSVATLRGTILGVEVKPASGKDAAFEVLNLWCEEGMRSVPCAEIQRIKFMNPAVESEVIRALEVLARGHDSQKKAVALQFNGQGKRGVRVGYVVETPLWRTSYRLLIGKDGKLAVQGWALVENPTNEDWKDVSMALVSGQPISFKMDLYQPHYVPRPVVQQNGYVAVQPTMHTAAPLVTTSSTPGTLGTSAALGAVPQMPDRTNEFSFYVGVFKGGAAGASQEGLPQAEFKPRPLSDISLQNGIVAALTVSDLGDSFQYTIEHPVTIARQKSALLPIVNQGLEGDKVSLYCPNAHAKYPLLALRLKNTTGVHLTQGPVAVFEGTGYCGDTQMPDLQPGEERLVSYALDLGTEVESSPSSANPQLWSVRVNKGVMTMTGKTQNSLKYTVKNRGTHDRTVLIEHPNRANFKLVSKDQPKERTKEVYRFEVAVAAGTSGQLEVVEEMETTTSMRLFSADKTRFFLQYEFSNAEAKTALEKLLTMQMELNKTYQEQGKLQSQLTDINNDQARLRANLREMPADSAAYKRYLEKFDKQETAIEELQTQLKTLQAQVAEQQRACEEFFASLDFETTMRSK